MPIVGSLPVQLANNTTADATQVMSDFNYIVSQINSNGAGLSQANNFTGGLQQVAGDTICTLLAIQTLTNKTLTSPTITSILSGAGTWTVPAVTDQLVGRATVDTLTNKTLTAPIINNATENSPTINTPAISGATFTGTKGVALTAVKPSTTGRASTTTLTDDPDLIISLPPGTYAIDMWLPFFGTTQGSQGFQYKLNFTGTQTNFIWSDIGSNTAVLDLTAVILGTHSFSAISSSGALFNADWLRVTGSITVSATGNLSLQWAQNTSSGFATSVGAGGYLNCMRVA